MPIRLSCRRIRIAGGDSAGITRLLWKRRIGRFWKTFSHHGPRRIILLYHAIGNGPYAVSRQEFRQQLAWLSNFATICTLDDIVNHSTDEGIRVAITFDDGYQCLVKEALPVLDELNIPATVFLNSGWISDVSSLDSVPSQGHYPEEKFLIWDDIGALLECGWNIGSHGVNHLDLTTCDKKTVRQELVNSKSKIEDKLGRPCNYFAYTWGSFNKYLLQAVKDAGYTHGFTGLHAPVVKNSNNYLLPRMDVRKDYSMSDFKSLVSGNWDFLGYKQRLTRLFV